jgi:serine/threonine protein phosphatase PrpC
LTRAIGMEAAPPIALRSEDLRSGDVFLLCSDGLWGAVEDEDIAAMLRERDPEDACLALVEAAHLGGSYDNITAIVVGVA